MQRRQQEEQRVRVRGDHEQGQRAERQQRGRVAGELVLDTDLSPRYEPLARHEPARECEQPEHEQQPCGPVRCCVASRGDRPRGAVGPRAEQAEDLEEDNDPHPEAEPTPQCAQRRRQGDTSPAAAREQIDGRCEEREQACHEHELDRPPADHPRAEIEVAGGASRELEALVERAEQILGRPADLVQLVDAQPLGDVAERIRRIVACGRECERADALCEERRLLVEGVRKAEVSELAQDRIPRRAATDLRSDARGGCLDERSGGVPRDVAVDLHPDRSRAAHRIEVDHGGDVVAERRVGGERGRAEGAERAAVGRDEKDRVVRPEGPAGEAGRRSVGARQLHQHGGTGGIVVRAEPCAVVVAVGHHDDRPRRTPNRLGDEVLHLHAAVARDDGAEAFCPDRQPVGLELVAEPLRRPDRPREAIGLERDEIVGELLRGLAVELREERARQRRRPRNAEGGNEQGQADEQPRPSIEAPVDRPLH